MKKTLLLYSILLHSIIVNAQSYEWLASSRQYNSNQNIPVATDASGNVFTLISVDNNAPCVIQGDTIYAVVPNTSGCVVAKFSPEGTLLWGKMISPDGGGIYGGRLVVDNAGAVYASITFPNGGGVHLLDTVYAPGATTSAYIIKLSSSGSFMHGKTYSSGTFLSPPVMSCLGTDIYAATANYLEKLDSSLNTVWNITDANNSLAFSHTAGSKADIFVQANGQLVVSAWEFGNTIGDVPFGDDTIHFHIGGLDEAAVIKLDTSGHVLWTKAFPCNDASPAIRAVCLDMQGNAYLGLEGCSDTLFFGNDTLADSFGSGGYCAILKWNDNGIPIHAIGLYPYASPPDLMELTVNAQSSLLVTGMIGSSRMYIDANDSIDGYGNLFLIKYDSAGVYKWFKTEAHNTSTFVDGIAVRNGNEYVLGCSTGSGSNYQFDCIPYPTAGSTNFVTVVSEQPVQYPVSSFTYTNMDSLYTFTDHSQNATAWHWDFGNGPGDTSDLQNPIHSFLRGANYMVVLTVNQGGCSATDTVQLLNVGFDETSGFGSFLFYPNPVEDILNIHATMELHDVSLTVLNMLGQALKKSIVNGRNLTVSTRDLENGVYALQLQSGNQQINTTFIKVK